MDENTPNGDASHSPTANDDDLKSLGTTFRRLVAQWHLDTDMSSSLSVKLNHPAYREIIRLGESALPFILRELRDRPVHWFQALKDIVGETPVPETQRADPRVARNAWLAWGKAKGLIS